MSGPNDYNQSIITQFRANGGKVDERPLLLLTTIGAKSGKERVSPLVYTTDSGRLVIIASKGGAPSNPDWYYNLIANPVVTVELGTERFQARATVTAGAERARLFGQMVAERPGFAAYQQKTSREIPVIVLDRVG
jgi:deazaflavin-dependent oxidoreductase (nitroreductase family)